MPSGPRLEADRLYLLYQPKVDVRSERVVAVEALVRWGLPSGKTLPPSAFIPIAEETGLIGQLTAWVLRRAIDQAGRWRQQGIDLGLAVNISAVDLNDPSLPDRIERQCAEVGFPTERLRLEVAEQAAMADHGWVDERMSRLRAKGIELAIDDFGTGYSSPLHLHRLPISEIKIDQWLVLEMAHVRDLTSVAKTIVDIGHNLGARVTAEGVETEGVLALLRACGCDLAQGCCFSPPLAVDGIEKLVRGDDGADDQPKFGT